MESEERCPACGLEFCPGHNRNRDPNRWMIVLAHLTGDHAGCDPAACKESLWRPLMERMAR